MKIIVAFYDGLLSLIERNGPGTYIAAYTKLPGAPGGIGGLISSYDGTNTLYYHDSNLGNVNQVTNSAGAVIQTYDYDSFGNITAQSGALTAKYAYKTKEYSPETGLIFFGARYYNPLIGRFITPDPLGQVDGPNVYLYLNDDPVNKYDLWGLYNVDIWKYSKGYNEHNWSAAYLKQYFDNFNLCGGQWNIIEIPAGDKNQVAFMLGIDPILFGDTPPLLPAPPEALRLTGPKPTPLLPGPPDLLRLPGPKPTPDVPWHEQIPKDPQIHPNHESDQIG